jgi:hypothetical protein
VKFRVSRTNAEGIVRSYIIRIYRDGKEKGKQFLGTIERAGKKAKLAFTNRDELWDILYIGKGKRDDPEERETRKE